MVTPSHYLYRFEQYGVPQARHRVIVAGIRNDLDVEFRVPAETHRHDYVSCRSAIEDPPIGAEVANQEFTKAK